MREIMSAMKAKEKAAETDRREKEKAVTMKAGNDLDGHWVCITRVSFLVISFTSENNCLARIFSFFPLVSPSYILVRSLTLSPSSRVSSFSHYFSRYAPQLQIICNFVCPRAFVLRVPLPLKNSTFEIKFSFNPASMMSWHYVLLLIKMTYWYNIMDR